MRTAHLMPSFGPVLTEFVGTCLQHGRQAADPDAIDWQQEPFWGHCSYLDGLLQRTLSPRATLSAWRTSRSRPCSPVRLRRVFPSNACLRSWNSETIRTDLREVGECVEEVVAAAHAP